jgi:hypothetical protein
MVAGVLRVEARSGHATNTAVIPTNVGTHCSVLSNGKVHPVLLQMQGRIDTGCGTVGALGPDVRRDDGGVGVGLSEADGDHDANHPHTPLENNASNCPSSIFDAAITACVRLSTSSFCRIADTCAFTVASEIDSS